MELNSYRKPCKLHAQLCDMFCLTCVNFQCMQCPDKHKSIIRSKTLDANYEADPLIARENKGAHNKN